MNLLDLLCVYEEFCCDPNDIGNGNCGRLWGQLELIPLFDELFGQVDEGEGLAFQLETPNAFATALFDANNVETAGKGLLLVPELYAGIVPGVDVLLIAELVGKFDEEALNINGLLFTPI